jgi:hypothetical protein
VITNVAFRYRQTFPSDQLLTHCLKRLGKSIDDHDGRVPNAALDPADVGLVLARSVEL